MDRYERALRRGSPRRETDQTLAGGSSLRSRVARVDEVGEQADRDHLERREQDQQRVGRDVEVELDRGRR